MLRTADVADGRAGWSGWCLEARVWWRSGGGGASAAVTNAMDLGSNERIRPTRKKEKESNELDGSELTRTRACGTRGETMNDGAFWKWRRRKGDSLGFHERRREREKLSRCWPQSVYEHCLGMWCVRVSRRLSLLPAPLAQTEVLKCSATMQ